MKRRAFLKGAGAVTVLVAAGGVWRAWDHGVFSAHSGPAYEAWKNWRGSADGPLALVRAAILAANAMNSQPWLFKVTDTRIEIYADQGRNGGAFDPFLREMYISLGCALENLLLAAPAHGYQASVTLQPGALAPIPGHPQPQLAASVDLAPSSPSEGELFTAIPARHTNRFPFDASRPLPEGFAEEVHRAVQDEPEAKLFLFHDDDARRQAAHLISDSADTLSRHPEVFAGSARWVRTRWSDLEKQRDGVSFDDFQPPLDAALSKFLPPSMLARFAVRQVKGAYAGLMMTGRLHGLIAVRDRYEQSASMRAGRIWQRAHLLATARGLAARPANQAVELIDQERVWGQPAQSAARLAQLTGDPAWQPTFMFYMGYPTRPQGPSARRPAEEVLS